MHELSIAYNLVEIAHHAAQEAGVPQVDTVYLQLGALSGVVKDALLFGYDVATEGTLLQGSKLEIEELPVITYCDSCQKECEIEDIQLLQCPNCHSWTPTILQGKELQITSLEYSDETAVT